MNTKEEFDRLMSKIRDGILVVVDEAYYEYVTDTGYADSFLNTSGTAGGRIL